MVVVEMFWLDLQRVSTALQRPAANLTGKGAEERPGTFTTPATPFVRDGSVSLAKFYPGTKQRGRKANMEVEGKTMDEEHVTALTWTTTATGEGCEERKGISSCVFRQLHFRSEFLIVSHLTDMYISSPSNSASIDDKADVLQFVMDHCDSSAYTRSPFTKANRIQSPARSPGFRKWESFRTTPLVRGFSRGSPVSPALSFRRCSTFTSITLIGSQDLAVKSRPNLFTHSLLVPTPAPIFLPNHLLCRLPPCQLFGDRAYVIFKVYLFFLNQTFKKSLIYDAFSSFVNMSLLTSVLYFCYHNLISCFESLSVLHTSGQVSSLSLHECNGEKAPTSRENAPTSIVGVPTGFGDRSSAIDVHMFRSSVYVEGLHCSGDKAPTLEADPFEDFNNIEEIRTQLLVLPGTKVAERLASSPPTKANRVQSPAGSPNPVMTLVDGFSRGPPVSPVPLFRRRSIFNSITLIGSQDLTVKSRPNFFFPIRVIEVSMDQRRNERTGKTGDLRETALSGTIPQAKAGVTRRFGWEASRLTAQPPWPPLQRRVGWFWRVEWVHAPYNPAYRYAVLLPAGGWRKHLFGK
ncbi:hypothetical protein PR048_008847 [Dryococelus australis]|uniref:Uncharacterized protein n=1 Tax=Dryococelus australis TaxID=614101 RepID=A0ABQ9HY90_9NEOP|nr:hypothetical protein PR048_008847 [Dryococelus australis]